MKILEEEHVRRGKDVFSGMRFKSCVLGLSFAPHVVKVNRSAHVKNRQAIMKRTVVVKLKKPQKSLTFVRLSKGQENRIPLFAARDTMAGMSMSIREDQT